MTQMEDTHCKTKQIDIYINAFSRCFYLQQLPKSRNRAIGQTANNINLINVQFIMMNGSCASVRRLTAGEGSEGSDLSERHWMG